MATECHGVFTQGTAGCFWRTVQYLGSLSKGQGKKMALGVSENREKKNKTGFVRGNLIKQRLNDIELLSINTQIGKHEGKKGSV